MDYKFQIGELVQHKASRVEAIVVYRYQLGSKNWYEIEVDFKHRIDAEEFTLEPVADKNK